MARSDKHPSASQLARLAVGELRPRKAARLEAHVARCEQCTRICQQLGGVRAILAGTSYPPMPEDLSARIGSAIRREAQQRVAAMPATETGRRDLRARRQRAWADGGWHLLGLPFAATRLAAAASTAAIAAAGGYLMAGDVGASVASSSSSALAGAAVPAQKMSAGPDVTYGRPGLLHTIRVAESRTNFVAAHLRAEATSALLTAETRETVGARASASAAAPRTGSAAKGPSVRQLAGCLGRISPDRTVLLFDVARYQGKPAEVIVTAPTVVSDAEAWVVGPSCSATTKDVVTSAALVNF